MDEATRGFIESMIDGALAENVDYLPDIEWVRNEIPISSFNDLFLGFLIGCLNVMLVSVVALREGSRHTTDEEKNIIKSILIRRLPEILKKARSEIGR